MLLSSFNAFALTRSEMKNVKGGCAATYTVPANGSPGKSYSVTNSSSMVKQTNSDGSTTYTWYGVNKSEATQFGSGSRYCCQSCSKATWYKP